MCKCLTNWFKSYRSDCWGRWNRSCVQHGLLNPLSCELSLCWHCYRHSFGTLSFWTASMWQTHCRFTDTFLSPATHSVCVFKIVGAIDHIDISRPPCGWVGSFAADRPLLPTISWPVLSNHSALCDCYVIGRPACVVVGKKLKATVSFRSLFPDREKRTGSAGGGKTAYIYVLLFS